jgi:hypothetical protein
VANRTVSFTLGAQSCSGVTNTSGVASCVILVNSPPGPSIPITVLQLTDTARLRAVLV